MVGLSLNERVGTCQELEEAKQQLRDRLEFIGLGESVLETQDSEQLVESLRRIDECIANPEDFRLLEVQRGDRLQRYILYAGIKFNFELFQPILFESKAKILNRLESFQVNKKVKDLHASVRRLTDETSQTRLICEINELLELSQKWREQYHQLAQEQQHLRDQATKNNLELLERRQKIWSSFLRKEPVATFVGAILLLLISTVQIVLIFAQLEPSEILNNSFLLILGYFFGQSTQNSVRREG